MRSIRLIGIIILVFSNVSLSRPGQARVADQPTRTYRFALKTVHVITTFSPNSDSIFAAFAVNVDRSPQDVGMLQQSLGNLHEGDYKEIDELTINVPNIKKSSNIFVAFYVANVGHADGKRVADLGLSDILYTDLKHNPGAIDNAFHGYPRSPGAIWALQKRHFVDNKEMSGCDGVAAADLFMLPGVELFTTSDLATIGRPYPFQFQKYMNVSPVPGTLNCQNSTYRIVMIVTRVN